MRSSAPSATSCPKGRRSTSAGAARWGSPAMAGRWSAGSTPSTISPCAAATPATGWRWRPPARSTSPTCWRGGRRRASRASIPRASRSCARRAPASPPWASPPSRVWPPRAAIGYTGASFLTTSSIHDLYAARGRGEVPAAFTVPAINIRGMAYDTARALFRARKALDAGAVLCEIARSEIAYTDQRPAEYAFVVLAAALREGWTGPVFLQGDHFQINAKKYAGDPEGEMKALRELTAEAIQA